LGFFALLLGGCLVWQRRKSLQHLPLHTDSQGLWLLLLGALLAWLGYRLIMRFLLALSLACLAAGSVWWLCGRRWAAHLWFPFLLLAGVAPLPLDLVGAIAFRLQNIVARLATFLIGVLGVPVERDGVTLWIGGHAVQVNEACSGWHTFSAAVWLFLVLLYWQRPDRWWRWVAVLLLLLPLAVFANTLRVTTVALGIAFRQSWVAVSPWHELIGMVYFLGLALVLMRWLTAGKGRQQEMPSPDLPDLSSSRALSKRALWAWAVGLWLLLGITLASVWQSRHAVAALRLPTFPTRLGDWTLMQFQDDDAGDGEWFAQATYRSPDGQRLVKAFLHLPLNATKRPKRLLNLWLGIGYELVANRTILTKTKIRPVPIQIARFTRANEQVIVAVTYLHPDQAVTSPVSARLRRIWEQLRYGMPQPWVTVGVAAPDEKSALTLERLLVAEVEEWLQRSLLPQRERRY
jgi:exosortase